MRTESVTDPDDWLELRLPGARADLAAKLIEALKAVVEEPNDDNVIRLPVEPELDSTTRIGGLRCRDGEELEIHIRDGFVEIPIFDPPECGAVPVMVLALSPRQARDLAGMLIYAAGRVDEGS